MAGIILQEGKSGNIIILMVLSRRILACKLILRQAETIGYYTYAYTLPLLSGWLGTFLDKSIQHRWLVKKYPLFKSIH